MMRPVPLLIGVLFLTGCGAAMAEEQPAAEVDTARIVFSWGTGDKMTGTYDLRDGTGVVDRTILALDAVYEPLEIRPAGALGKRWLKSPREGWDPLFDGIGGGARELLTVVETSGNAERVGAGEERGEPVTYFVAAVRMDEFLARLEPAQRAQFDSDYYRAWEGLVFEYAVDSERRIRKVDFSDEGHEFVIEIFDYGIPVDARAPDPRTVLTWEEYETLLRAECERAEKEGREDEVPHCGRCGAEESAGEAA